MIETYLEKMSNIYLLTTQVSDYLLFYEVECLYFILFFNPYFFFLFSFFHVSMSSMNNNVTHRSESI